MLLAGHALATDATPAARQLAQDAVIVDTHIDAPSELLKEWKDLGERSEGRQFDYPKSREGGLDVAFMSIYTSANEDETGKAWQIANMQIDAVEALVARHPDRFALLTSPGDVERLRAGGRVLLALGMENGGRSTRISRSWRASRRAECATSPSPTAAATASAMLPTIRATAGMA